jgi:hypothetical protein
VRLLPQRCDADGRRPSSTRTPRATDEQIQQALSGVLVPMLRNVRMLAAIKRYAKEAAV